jgi:cell wall-associated NlpC family hydrolase
MRDLHRIFIVRGRGQGAATGMVDAMRATRTAVAGILAGVLVVGVGAVTSSVTAAPRQDLQQVAAQVRDLQMQAEAATERANEAQGRLEGIQTDLSTVRNRADRERADLQRLRSTIEDIARTTYARGGMDPTLEVLLADDPAQFLAQAAVMSQLEQNQIDQLRGTQTAKLRLAQTEAEITDKEQSAQQARDDMASARSDAESQLSAAQDVLSGLQADERQRLAEMAAQKRAQEVAAAQAAARASAAAAAADNSGSGNGGNNQDNGSSGSQDNGSSGSQDNGSSGGQDSGAASGGGGYTGGSRAAVAVQYALSQVGDRYVAAQDGPDSYDCSGLTMAAWRQAGVSLAHMSYSQYDETTHIPVSEIQPGDLVFYFGGGAHHVGMYVGNGKMVSASNPSDGVELIDFLGPWYGDRFSGVGRVLG